MKWRIDYSGNADKFIQKHNVRIKVRNEIKKFLIKMKGVFSEPLALAQRILSQRRQDKDKIYSIHVPEVECISKGKAHKKYEFGCKVSVAATSRECFIVGMKAYHGNPYDGHTLNDAVLQTEG